MPPTFADLGVPTPLASALAARGIDTPFPIQAATIPDALAGRDLCGRAPTGSGKTIAFGIPLVVRVGRAEPRRPRALVLVPTRELASQVCDELGLLAGRDGPRVEAFYGGVSFHHQLRALSRGVDIAVACPGRLADLINQGEVTLADVELVVLDEADRMADMGFLPDVRRLLDQCREDRQTLLFSATLDGDVDVLITRYQRDPVRHEHAGEDDGGRAEHRFWKVERTDRLSTAAAIADRAGPTVVFCRTKRGADRIAKQLEAAGVRAAAIHGDRSQAQRELALERFHRGQVDALVATDVAARGIHVDGVACVIHYDPPADHKDYVHRSGRTARAGNTGLVVTLVLPEARKAVRDLQKDLGFEQALGDVDLVEVDEHGAIARAEAATRRAAAAAAPAPRGRSTARTKPSDGRRGGPERTRSRDDRRADRPATSRHTSGRSGPRPDRAAPARADRDRQPSRPTVDRSTPAPRPAARDDRAPLEPGQRRPSGAARRKAKRLAAMEAAALDLRRGADLRHDDDADDLRDGRSSRPRRSDGGRGPGRAASDRGAARRSAAPKEGRGSSTSRGAGRTSSSSRTPAPRRSGPPSTASSGRPGSRSTAGSRSGRSGAQGNASRSASTRGRSGGGRPTR